MTRPATAVVFGGTGFLGGHVTEALAAEGWQVLPVSRTGRHRLDLGRTTPAILAAFLDEHGPDLVVNATGSSWGLAEEDMLEHCLNPTERLLHALARHRSRPRLVHLGSVLEYGPTDPGTPVSAESPPPETSYGKAKLAASQTVVAAARTGQADAVVLRVANALGPRLPPTSLLGKAAEALTEAARSGRAAELSLSRLTARRDYLDVRDAAQAVLAAARAPVAGEIIDIGRGQAVPVRSLVRLLIEVAGVPATVVEHESQGWRQAMDWIQVDPARAHALLDWRPRYELIDSVRAFWRDRISRPA